MTTKAKLIKEGEAFFQSVLKANEDLPIRLREVSPGITYDREDDTFILTLGEPRGLDGEPGWEPALHQGRSTNLEDRWNRDSGLDEPHWR